MKNFFVGEEHHEVLSIFNRLEIAKVQSRFGESNICELCNEILPIETNIMCHRKFNCRTLRSFKEEVRKSGECKCPKCGKTYAYAKSLSRHLKFQCGRAEFKCTLCNYETKQKINWLKHCQTKHNTNILVSTSD